MDNFQKYNIFNNVISSQILNLVVNLYIFHDAMCINVLIKFAP
jgi:hypothetical protein